MISDNGQGRKTDIRVALEDTVIVFIFVMLTQLMYAFTQSGTLPDIAALYLGFLMGALAGLSAWAKLRLIDLKG